MKDYKRLTKNDWHNAKFSVITHKDNRAVLHRLWELENRIESGEIVDRNAYLDYLMAAKNTLELTDKEIEFFAKHNARVRKNADAEIARLTAELEKYKRALSKVIKDRNVLAKDFYYMVEGEGQLYEDYYLGWVEHEMQEERKND